MILNASKASIFTLCKRKAFNVTHRGLRGEATQGMVDGTAFHAGVAHGGATGDWDAAIEAANLSFDSEMAKKVVMLGEEGIVEDNRKVVIEMLKCYKNAYKQHPVTTLMPECKFKVNVPGTEHNDITTHWLEVNKQTGLTTEKWNHFYKLDKYPEKDEPLPSGIVLDKMDPEAILDKRIRSPHPLVWGDHKCPCYLPHQLRGITDAVVKWGNFVWLQEHKTSAKVDEVFWLEFQLDIQISMYLYGIWKATGVRPAGAIVNVIRKPSEGQVRQWNKSRSAQFKTPLHEYIQFYREPITRELADLERFEREIGWLGDEWEERILSGRFPMSPVKGICTNFNRPCQFHSLCLARDSAEELVQIREQLTGKKEL